MPAHCEFSHSAAAATHNGTTPTSSSSSSSSSTTTTTGRTSSSMKKKNTSNMRRFSDEQIKLLESIFETESKLDHSKKLQLASELGLQPRQVAIWFQNRRARSKSKHLQRSYSVLQANYEALASEFEALKKENHALLQELQKLKYLEDQSFSCGKVRGENMQPSSSMERSEQIIGVVSDDDGSMNAGYFGLEDEEPSILNLTSQEVWRNLESADDFWWDFWS